MVSDTPPYPRWVGLLIGFLFPGLTHFLCGERIAGVRWYLCLLACAVLGIGLIATPGLSSYVLGVVCLLAEVVMGLVVLVKSYRPVPRIGLLRLGAIFVAIFLFGNVLQIVARQLVHPFKVPTGAMQPTIMGVHARTMSAEAPERPGPLHLVLNGERFVDVRASTSGTVSFLRSNPVDPTQWECMVGSEVHRVPRTVQLLKRPGEIVLSGETLWSGIVTSGDRVLAEKVSYRFGKPRRGHIVVFSTDGIPGLSPGVCYVKRVAGLPGERIRIEPPFLMVNDQKVTEPPIFATISSGQNGYAGFRLPPAAYGGLLMKPEDEIVLKDDEYFVLGDNTDNSKDSRYWGPVPRKNIVGRVTRIYWPFNRINVLDRGYAQAERQ